MSGYHLYTVSNSGILGKMPTGNRRFWARDMGEGIVQVFCHNTLKHCQVPAKVWAWCDPHLCKEYDREAVKRILEGKMEGKKNLSSIIRRVYASI